MTSDTILNNKRRLERHTRRDGNLQARARPASLEQRSEDNAGSVEYIRNFVEKADLDRRFNIFSVEPASSASDASSDPATSAADSGSQTTARSGNSGGNAGGNGDSATSAARTTARAATTQAPKATSATQNVPVVQNTFSSASAATRHTTQSAAVASTKAPVLTTTAAAAQATTASSSSSSLDLSTAVAFVTATPSQSGNIAASSSTSTGKSNSSGVGVGPIIGIVAGCLAGVAVIAVIAGYLFKKFGRKEDPYETDPFSSDDFRSHSAMLPDAFESEDGHGEMAEYQQNNMSPFGYEGGGGYGAAAGAGAGAGIGAMAGGMAAASAYNSHNNENGGRPRPPSMFEKHINGQAAYNNNEHLPQIGNVYNPNELSPQLPAMAFGGSDPYTIAGVGRNHQMDSNVSNPYAHLDRSPSAMVQRNVSQAGQVDRGNGSNGSSYQQYSEHYQTPLNEYDYDTAGRPGTAEGRSGTPDLPNVQQTYAGTSTDGRQEMDRVASPHHMMSSPELPHEYYSQAGYENNNAAPQQPLQVRNLLPNPGQSQQPPRMSAVSEQAGEDDAYGGVW
jgi:hypothetical protein